MTDPEHASGENAAVAAFVGKWHAREPEMIFAEVFCPRPLRLRFALWGALLFELREAAFELSDARLIEVKSAWWADECVRCAQDAPRHPLTQALAMPQLPWNELARGMLAMAHADASRPVDREAALASVAPFAHGVAMFEAALVGGSNAESFVRAISVHLLEQRLRIGLGTADGGRVPLTMLARHGIASAALAQPEGAAAVGDWAAELAAALPKAPTGLPLYRSARIAFDAWFLGEMAAHRPRRDIPRLRALALAWAAARRSRLAG